MKKLTYRIRKGTKNIILGLSVLGVLGLSAMHSQAAKKALPSFAFVGLVATLKSKGKWDALDAETKALAETMDEGYKGLVDMSALDEKLTGFAKTAEIKGLLTAEEQLEFKEMITGYKNVAKELQKLKEAGIAGGNGGNMLKLMFEEHKDQLEKFRKKEIKTLSLETKTADTGDIATHTIGYRVPGIGQLPVRRPFMLDLFTTIPVNLEFIKYMDQETVVRDARNVAGITPVAGGKTNTALTWKERNIQITKVKDFIDINVDMMADYDFVMGELQQLVNTSVILKADNGLLKDDGIYPNVHSVNEVASEFDAGNTLTNTITPWAGTVQAPDMFSLTIAMASQIIALGQDGSYMPDTVLWNTIDKYKSMLIKDKMGQYLMPPFVAVVNNKEYTIDGMKVRTNPNVAANTCYVFDSTKATIYMRKGIGVDLAYENNNNFEVETVTMKAYLRMNMLIRNIHKNAFMKCSDVAAAIVALTKV